MKSNKLWVPQILVCLEIKTNQQSYKKGDLVVTEVIDGGEMLRGDVGLIEMIQNSKVILVMRKFLAVQQFLGYYESSKSVTGL